MNQEVKWINDYINNINLNNIEWINLNAKELYFFYHENYLDKNVWQFVHDKNVHTLFPLPLGMHYLNFESPINQKSYNFFLGIANNSINKKTIVGAIIYKDKYYLLKNYTPLTYISSVETNYYFRNKGIFKKMCEEFFNYVNQDQIILTTTESELGQKCRALEIFKDIFKNKGFEKLIIEDEGYLTIKKIYKNNDNNDKTLKKTL